jgi:hypothetical protein
MPKKDVPGNLYPEKADPVGMPPIAANFGKT